MRSDLKYRLADSTVIEPLINLWSAWPYLISPVPASFHLLRYQTKLLESYLENPELHARASSDPDLAGGAFVGIPAHRAGEVRRLLEYTLERQGANLELAGDIIEFHNRLVAEADGLSLAPYYDLLPDSLRGYVELIYDYYNRPTMRFFENLLYGSSYYQKGLQALRLFKLERDNSRSFLINTPRLMEDDQIHWEVAYDDPRVDELFSLDRRPMELGRIIELLGLKGADTARLMPLLSESPRSCAERWGGREVRVRCLGHACALVEWNGVSILTDPYIPVTPSAGGLARISYQDLPETIDYALITHIHHDHFALESLLRLRHRIEQIVVPRASGMLYGDVSLRLMCRKLGFKNVTELEPMESIDLSDLSITAIPFLGEHGDLGHSKSAYVIRAGKERIMFGADSDCLDKRLYRHIRQSLGPIETVFLGTESVGAPLSWIYGPLLPSPPHRDHDESRRQHGSNSRAALDILEAVGAKRVFNYAMGLEPWMEYVLGLGLTEDAPQWKESTRLLNKARARGFLDAERPYGNFELRLGEGSMLRSDDIPDVGQDAGASNGAGQDVQGGPQTPPPVSFYQEKILGRARSQTDGEPDNVSAVLRLSGRASVDALERAFAEIQRRHSILRTRFASVDGRLVQLTPASPTAPLQLADLTGWPNPEKEYDLILTEQARRPFDLAGGILVRSMLLRIAADDHILSVSLPGGVADDRSIELLVGELLALYGAFADGKPSPLPEPAMQFHEFAARQRRFAGSEAGRRLLGFWKRQLEGRPSPLDLAEVFSAPTGKKQGVNRQSFELSAGQTRSLKELAAAQNCSLLVILVAALQTLLHRYCGQEEFLIGTRISGRNSPETEYVIGPLSNTVVLRTDLSGEPEFSTLVVRTREVTARVLEHGDLPFELLSELEDQSRPADAAFRPDAMLIIDEPAPRQKISGIEVERLQTSRLPTESDLALRVIDEAGVLACTIEFNSEVLGSHAVSTFIKHFKSLAQAVTAHPEIPIGEIPFIAETPSGDDDTSPRYRKANDAGAQFAF